MATPKLKMLIFRSQMESKGRGAELKPEGGEEEQDKVLHIFNQLVKLHNILFLRVSVK